MLTHQHVGCSRQRHTICGSLQVCLGVGLRAQGVSAMLAQAVVSLSSGVPSMVSAITHNSNRQTFCTTWDKLNRHLQGVQEDVANCLPAVTSLLALKFAATLAFSNYLQTLGASTPPRSNMGSSVCSRFFCLSRRRRPKYTNVK